MSLGKRHDLGTQELNWDDILGFNFIYGKVIVKKRKKRNCRVHEELIRLVKKNKHCVRKGTRS